DWVDVVGIVRDLAAELGVEVQVENDQLAPWHPGRCARVVLVAADGSRTTLGHAGELHPRVVARLGLPARTSAAELDLDLLLAGVPDAVRGPVFSAYPVAKEDVALLVDASVPAGDVESALREGAGELLESLRLFDVYTGAGVEDGRKSLAFALRFRALDRTLAEGEAAAARDAAVALAGERTGAVLRG
ncbi:MAG TPA: phenylalanine--tRNA ligase subunit beta, partial [Nocardioides sp.]